MELAIPSDRKTISTYRTESDQSKGGPASYLERKHAKTRKQVDEMRRSKINQEVSSLKQKPTISAVSQLLMKTKRTCAGGESFRR